MKIHRALFAVVFLIGIGVAAAQNPTPSNQARQIQLQKEAMRRAEAQAQAFTILGFPMLNPVPASSDPLAAAKENRQQMTAFSGT